MDISQHHQQDDVPPIAADIWHMKYRLKKPDGTPVDTSIDDSWRRVARAAAEAEPEERRGHWAKAFHDILKDYRFLPAGRILAGAGSARDVTLFNCFVMGPLNDSMAGIFEGLKESAVTLQRGGGIGVDFSSLRPAGAGVSGIGADASGPVSFMHVWDAMCRTIMSAGARRGAMMATLACDHPDIETFIDAKRASDALRMFNLSVLVSDAFMAAVKEGADWPLVFGGQTFKTVPARQLWGRIMRATYDYAEPGVIFIDRVNALNPLSYCEQISATNPCGEQPLPPYGACLLGSLNLARFVNDPFSDDARLDEDALAGVAGVAVRLMDNVIDISRYPLAAQKDQAMATRRIGLGVTGLANALQMTGLAYGSDAAARCAGRWMRLIEQAAYSASVDLAGEKGAFAAFDRDDYLAGEKISRLDEGLKKQIGRYGIRNALLTSIAPTGTISLFAGNVSSGIEPVFAHDYQRKVLARDGTRRVEQVVDYGVARYRAMFGADAVLPEHFVTAGDLTPDQHLKMMAALQPHVDSAISKTINCPPGISFEDFATIYRRAYERGLKGCTTYRPNPVTGAVLSVAVPVPESDENSQALLPLDAPAPPGLVPGAAGPDGGDVVCLKQPLERAQSLPGFTYKLKWPETGHAIYITLNDIMQDGRRRPFEIFINSKNMEHYAWTVALTRMISAVFRRGGDVSFVVEELKAVFDPRGGQWLDGKYVPSLLAAIGGIIERHLRDTGFISAVDGPGAVAGVPGSPTGSAAGHPGQCPKCAGAALIYQEGCAVCLSCSYSKCG